MRDQGHYGLLGTQPEGKINLESDSDTALGKISTGCGKDEIS